MGPLNMGDPFNDLTGTSNEKVSWQTFTIPILKLNHTVSSIQYIYYVYIIIYIYSSKYIYIFVYKENVNRHILQQFHDNSVQNIYVQRTFHLYAANYK